MNHHSHKKNHHSHDILFMIMESFTLFTLPSRRSFGSLRFFEVSLSSHFLPFPATDIHFKSKSNLILYYSNEARVMVD